MEAGGGEDLDGSDATEIPPVVTIWGKPNYGVVVTKDLAGNKLRPVCKHNILLSEALLSN